jgi:acetoin utilization deacetylase AcuC-like enzyme
MGYLDGDTVICATSFSAARYGAGAVLHAIDAVVRGNTTPERFHP